jgi:hypothetical protein
MGSAPPTPQLHELADTLWYERRLLEFLLFKLVSANLVLIANDHRFVAPAIAEVERVMEEVRRAEAERAGAVARLAAAWGVPHTQLTLAYLSTHVPDAMRTAFEEHRTGFLELVGEIEDLTRENRRLATVSLDGIRGTLGLVDGLTYDAAGRTSVSKGPPTTIDRVL